METGGRKQKRKMEGQRHRKVEERETRVETWRSKKKNRRRRMAVRKIPATKEGEDGQRPATFREERGQFRYKLLRNGA
ncbi:hypothetical protein NDU88_002872 [Pleurodeles waltl]|uniref:Uncharacterized protein n=1 Tax=Pleurodeles waltl TaxID=8319 RepID=A0AAV7KU13_PLEWA|nr:hypothetical protein NDU88_002872 [Pleurodeles waltl]